MVAEVSGNLVRTIQVGIPNKKSIWCKLTFAHFPVGLRLCRIAIVALLTVVTMATGCGVSAFQADATRHATGQLEEFHVEATPASVFVAVACWK